MIDVITKKMSWSGYFPEIMEEYYCFALDSNNKRLVLLTGDGQGPYDKTHLIAADPANPSSYQTLATVPHYVADGDCAFHNNVFYALVGSETTAARGIFRYDFTTSSWNVTKISEYISSFAFSS